MRVNTPFFLLLVGLLVCGTGLAHAQQMPEQAQAVTQPVTLKLQGGDLNAATPATTANVPDLDVYNTLTNPWLRDVLRLNHQNGLLQRLVERQENVSKVGASYAKMGLNYTPSPPDLKLCKQLPMNAPCASAYPDLYGGYVAARRAEIAQERKELEKQAAEIRARERAMAGKPVDESIPQFEWTDIRCLHNTCSAVVREKDNAAKTKTVRAGQTLAKNIQVAAISEQGVTLKVKGKAVDVPPAPVGEASGTTSSDSTQGSNPALNLANTAMQGFANPNQPVPFQTAGSPTQQQQGTASAAAAPAPASPQASGGSETQSQALGETGLF